MLYFETQTMKGEGKGNMDLYSA